MKKIVPSKEIISPRCVAEQLTDDLFLVTDTITGKKRFFCPSKASFSIWGKFNNFLITPQNLLLVYNIEKIGMNQFFKLDNFTHSSRLNFGNYYLVGNNLYLLFSPKGYKSFLSLDTLKNSAWVNFKEIDFVNENKIILKNKNKEMEFNPQTLEIFFK